MAVIGGFPEFQRESVRGSYFTPWGQVGGLFPSKVRRWAVFLSSIRGYRRKKGPFTLVGGLCASRLIEQRFRSVASEHPKTFSGKTRSTIPCTETQTQRGHSKFTACSGNSAVWWRSTLEYRRCHAEASALYPKC